MKKLSNKSKVINLGCRLNFFESEIIENILKKRKVKNSHKYMCCNKQCSAKINASSKKSS